MDIGLGRGGETCFLCDLFLGVGGEALFEQLKGSFLLFDRIVGDAWKLLGHGSF